MYEKEIEQLQEMIDESNRIVFFGGAGVSTESNIPDFRSATGIYHQKYKYSPEQIVSHSFFIQNPETGRIGADRKIAGCCDTEY